MPPPELPTAAQSYKDEPHRRSQVEHVVTDNSDNDNSEVEILVDQPNFSQNTLLCLHHF